LVVAVVVVVELVVVVEGMMLVVVVVVYVVVVVVVVMMGMFCNRVARRVCHGGVGFNITMISLRVVIVAIVRKSPCY
jgi:hypothetical protein